MHDYKVKIVVKENGFQTRKEMMDTGFISVSKAVDTVNNLIEQKFGSGRNFEVSRPPKRRRRV
jgi:hypothetical protein